MPTTTRKIRQRKSLESLGLTSLEAEVYEFLVHASPATGYRIAQAIGKSVGMIYKVVESLEAKGAAMSADDGESRVIRAVPVSDFVGRVRQEIEEACAAAEQGLVAESEPVPDDRLYRLTSREQVLQRAMAMLAQAERFTILTATPRPAAALIENLAEAAGRGVRVALKAFSAVRAAGVDVRLDPRGESAVSSAPGEWMTLTVDGRDVLVALFEHGTGVLHEAYWTQNPLVTWMMYTGLAADFAMADIREALAGGATAEQIKGRIEALAVYRAPDSVGKVALQSVYRKPSSGRTRRKPAEEREAS